MIFNNSFKKFQNFYSLLHRAGKIFSLSVREMPTTRDHKMTKDALFSCLFYMMTSSHHTYS